MVKSNFESALSPAIYGAGAFAALAGCIRVKRTVDHGKERQTGRKKKQSAGNIVRRENHVNGRKMCARNTVGPGGSLPVNGHENV